MANAKTRIPSICADRGGDGQRSSRLIKGSERVDVDSGELFPKLITLSLSDNLIYLPIVAMLQHGQYKILCSAQVPS